MRVENTHQPRILTLLRTEGPLPPASLGSRVGLSRSKIGQELGRLEELGFVEKAGHAASSGGRRSGLVRLSSRLRFVGVDIGATSLDVAVTDGRLSVLEHLAEPCDVRAGPEAVLDRVVELVNRMRASGLMTELHGAGVGIPAPVSFRDGSPVTPPIMPGWDRFPVRDALAERLGCPVLVDNDANTMALAESQVGLARGVPDFLFVKLGTGIGCGVVADHRVHRGGTGSAGDIGHIALEDAGPVCACGRTGCLEAWFGGAALARDARALAADGGSPLLAERLAERGGLSARDVSWALASGDPAALDLVRRGGQRLGRVLSGLVNFFNPSMIVVGGGVAGLGHTLLAEVRSELYRRSTPLATSDLPVVLSELGGSAGVVGAAGLVSDRVFAYLPEPPHLP
ncbi:ROK family transcriptional regulator [Streptomyces hainanensis]|uniref:ROK family transcriptional regulator n=1 Tax=Streptomyces hainanensis TaxID=402648 RepID=A0A4R4TJ01_9ACTN|nr:ROK family transcriptional regulator [Streptomyces hainanensis]TDC76376.1 ROK family transcriptional regulator [Streptomyces hainanensis]